jgi:uncharacterized protein YsxB (DUF464 family)
MIEVVVKTSAISGQPQIAQITMQGHAGSGEYGNDLVCAAASALIITFVNSVETLCGRDMSPEVRSGYLDVVLRAEQYEQLLAQSLLVGLEGLMRDHGAYIMVRRIGI